MCHRRTIYLKGHTPFEGVPCCAWERVAEVPMASPAAASALANLMVRSDQTGTRKLLNGGGYRALETSAHRCPAPPFPIPTYRAPGSSSCILSKD